MRLLQDGLVALLAAIGLATLLWLIVSVVFRLHKETLHHVSALVPARGAANGLEHTVHTLEQLRYELTFSSSRSFFLKEKGTKKNFVFSAGRGAAGRGECLGN